MLPQSLDAALKAELQFTQADLDERANAMRGSMHFAAVAKASDAHITSPAFLEGGTKDKRFKAFAQANKRRKGKINREVSALIRDIRERDAINERIRKRYLPSQPSHTSPSHTTPSLP